ncbi:MAG: DUF4159 domain-containing protein [Parvularculaceae bacterium]
MMTGLGALSFTSPLILIALAALPAIWFVLRVTPPSPRRLRFPAFFILRKLKTPEETPDRTPWQLLLLRLFLAACAIIGLAGPVLNAPEAATGAGPIVLVADDSWAAAPGWRLRREAMRLAADEAARDGRTVFILTTAPSAAAPGDILPMTGDEARRVADALKPQPLASDRTGAVKSLAALDAALSREDAKPEIRWLTDGLAGPGSAELADALAERGALTVFIDRQTPQLVLRAGAGDETGPAFRIERLRKGGAWEGELAATARDGRELARSTVALEAGAQSATQRLDLPLALRNELATVRIENVASAGAVYLSDARDRRALIGLIAGGDEGGDALLRGSHYIRKALSPYASFLIDTIDTLLASDVSVVILDDVGRLRRSDVEALEAWIDRGGVLVRFAGPNLADAASDGDAPLSPVPLRGGGRALGGALTWDTPQALGPFAPEGPFAGLKAPEDVLVRQQVLAQPGGETSRAVWASLVDGTPLVTGERRGLGALVLFHVTATPRWSDLPLSELFVEMLRRLVFLSTLGPEAGPDETDARYAPLRMLDGFGRFTEPGAELTGVTVAEAAEGPTAERPPGFYGAPEAPLAINAVADDMTLAPLIIPGAKTVAYAAEPPRRLGPVFLMIALALLVLDGFAALVISGRLRPGFVALLALVFVAPLNEARAQPLDGPVDQKAIDAALETRLAFVETGDPEIDRITEAGLAELSRQLYRRTTIEPAPPAAVDPETDDLSVYPLLYWPIAPGAAGLSEAGLANVENFMRFGGLIIFDTRDDERAIAGVETPEAAALRIILSQLDIPPLSPLPRDHVLTRSFFLLDELQGRTRVNPVWVAARSGGENDGVTPLIIGGRDWAGAWAADDFGRPLRPMGRGGERTREYAYRAGINMAMVAFTGNYKSDQVHAPILLQRLGR